LVEVLPLNASELSVYGFPAAVVQTWERAQGPHILPLPQHAIRDYGLLDNPNLLIAAPTSSGKTFCGELALVKTLCTRRKAVYLTPLRALAAEQFTRLQERYEPLGWKIRLVTGEYRDHHADLMRGDFDLAVVVYEKFERWLCRRLDQVAAVGLVVCDELQLIYDPGRGGKLEVMLSILTQIPNRPAILGLSAVLPEPERLASWLGLRVMKDSVRPAELRLGVYYNGHYRYREETTGVEGEEQWPGTCGVDANDQMLELARDAVRRGEQVLVFVESRARCQRLACALSERLGLPAARTAVERIGAQGRTATAKALHDCVCRGVAFHHAGLTTSQRETIESAARSGEIRVLVATGTLASGVNLPADTVIIRPYRFTTGAHQGDPVCLPLDWPEYENRAGRAGRFGVGHCPGRAILIAENEVEADVLWREFVSGRPKLPASGGSQLPSLEPARVLLEFMVSGLGRDAHALARAWAGTYVASCGESAPAIEPLIAYLIASGFVQCIPGRGYAPSALGEATVHSGISLAASLAMAGAATDPGYDDLERYTSLALSLPEAHELQWPSLRPSNSQDAPNDSSEPRVRRIQKRMLALVRGWREGEPTDCLELRFGLPTGVIAQNMQTVGWLLESAARGALALRAPSARVRALYRHSFEVKHGVPIRARYWVARRYRFLERDDILELNRAGFHGPRDWERAMKEGAPLCVAPSLIDSLSHSARADENLKEVDGMIRSRMGASNLSGAHVSREPRLSVDGSLRGERREVRWGGRTILLTPKCFKFLAKLAVSAATQPSRWVTRDELERGDNQARYLHRLRGEIEAQCADVPVLWENNRKGGYRMTLPGDRIEVNWDALETVDDYDLVSWVRTFRPAPAVSRPRPESALPLGAPAAA
jgi:superfamily II DNA/RNA helicase